MTQKLDPKDLVYNTFFFFFFMKFYSVGNFEFCLFILKGNAKALDFETK